MPGTHGSLMKAGKVRDATPKVPKTGKYTKPMPRIRNRAVFKRRYIHGLRPGQPPRRY